MNPNLPYKMVMPTISEVIERHSGLVCHFDYNAIFLPKLTLFKVKLDKIQIMRRP